MNHSTNVNTNDDTSNDINVGDNFMSDV
jgi:hypothetical protein